jgi:hypothetical protein
MTTESQTKVEEIIPNFNTELAKSFQGKDALISYVKEEKLTGGKKNEHQGRIVKVIKNLPVQIIGKGHYAAKQIENGNTEYEAKPRAWGIWNDDGMLEHKGELYVECIITGKGESSYLLDGEPIEKADIIGLPEVKLSEGTEIPVRAIKLKNVIGIEEKGA